MHSRKSNLVLHFVTWYPSAANHAEGIFIQRQIELLAENRNYNHVVVRKQNDTTGLWELLKMLFGFFSKETIRSVIVVSLPNESSWNLFFFWRFRQWFEKIILDRLHQQYQPSLAHLHVVYGLAEQVLYLQKSKNLPFIVTEHMGPFPFDWISNKDTLIIEPMKQASRIVAVSKAQASQIKSFTGVVSYVIPNVVCEKEFYFNSNFIQHLSKKQLQIVFTGVYTKAKGGDYLLSVFPEFLKKYPNSQLHLVGYATEERLKVLNERIQQSGIENNIHFHGNLSAAQICKLYQECDFYVCSSEWESFGLSVLEGLFTGLPALCTDCGGVSDFINDDNGLLIPNDQRTVTLLNGMLHMAANYHQYNKEQIAMNVRDKFSRVKIQEQYLNVYREVINNSTLA